MARLVQIANAGEMQTEASSAVRGFVDMSILPSVAGPERGERCPVGPVAGLRKLGLAVRMGYGGLGEPAPRTAEGAADIRRMVLGRRLFEAYRM